MILKVNSLFDILRTIFFAIDKVIYQFIPKIYNFLIQLARTSILSQADIIKVGDRIYKLLAVFMVFKVTFSLIMYVVNPDDFSDKSKGVGKLTANVVISLSLLILTPYLFNYAYKLQTIILEDNSLATVIFGEDEDDVNAFNTAGDTMAYMLIQPFFIPDISEIQSCSQLMVEENGKMVANKECTGLVQDSSLKFSEATDIESTDTLYSKTDSNTKFTEQTLKNYISGLNNKSIGLLLRQEIAVATAENSNGDEYYIIDYSYLFSTVVGALTILLLVTFCMDVALRSVKLAFLQLIAPIPIISYVDPKSGKDGIFKKWYKMCISTFVSLFVRLLALYFAAYIIARIDKLTDVVDGSYNNSLLLKVFVVIGCLMFVKQLPKILEGLGIKLDGGGKFTLNPFKKMENEMLGGKLAHNASKKVGNLAKGLGAAGLVGAAAFATGQGFRGMGSALKGGLKGDKFGKNFSNSYKAAHDRKKQVAQMRTDGITPFQVGMENFKNKFKGMDAKQEYDTLTGYVKSVQDDYKAYYNGILGADKVAKKLEQKRVSAENRGDSVAAQRLQDAIDARVAEVKSNGHKVALSVSNSSALETACIDIENGTAYNPTSFNSAGLSQNEDKGLASIDAKIGSTIKYVDSHFDGKFDYKAGELGDYNTDSLKVINGKAKSVDRAVKNSKDSIHVQDLYKYADGKKK